MIAKHIAVMLSLAWRISGRIFFDKKRYFAVVRAMMFITGPLTAKAGVVFQADFNGPDGTTGGATSMVTLGGTATLLGSTNMSASITNASPLFAGERGHLQTVRSGTGGAISCATIYPFSAANSPDSWLVLQSGTTTFNQINGALDFYFRDSNGSSGWTGSGVDFRPMDLNGGSGGLRIIINAPTTNRLQVELVSKNSSGTTVQDLRAFNSAVTVAANALNHLVVTASTNPTTGIVTLKLYLASGNTSIDTTLGTNLIASATSTAAITNTGANAVNHAFNATNGFSFGQISTVGSTVLKTTDFSSFRVYDTIPTVIATVNYQPNSATYLPCIPNVPRPNPEPALPLAFDPYSPPNATSGAPLINTPTAVEYTRTGDPGDGLVIAGNILSSYTGADAGKDSAYLCFGQNASSSGSVTASIERQSGDNAAIRLDANLPSSCMYLVWPRNGNGYGAPMVVNRTEAWWIGPDRVTQNDTASLYGRNLSFGISGSSSSNAWIYIKPQGAFSGQWVTPTAVNPYKVDFTVPASLTCGTYEVWGHNGHGGHYGWSGPLLLTVNDGITWTATQINVKDVAYGAKGDGTTDDTNAIKKALTASGSSAYSTVYFPAGTYMISSSLQSPPNVRWLGVGATTSIIKFTPGNRSWAVMAAIPTGTANVMVSSLGLDSGASVNSYLVNAYKPGSAPAVSGFQLLNCILTGTGVITATPTVSAFASGTTSITVSSTTGLLTGGWIMGPGFPSGETISSISGATIGLTLATDASESAETITVLSLSQGTLYFDPADHVTLRNVVFNGGGLCLIDSSQCIVDGCTFNGMWDSALLNIKGCSSQMSYTNNTGQDYDYSIGLAYDPATSTYAGDTVGIGWSQGVYFKGLIGTGARHNTYIGNNHGNNMGVRLGNPSGNNWGEQISFEQSYGQYYGTPTVSTGTSVTFDPATMSGTDSTVTGGTLSTVTPMTAVVIHGTGLGQWRTVGSINTTTGLVTLALGQSWNLPPDATSTVALGYYSDNVVSYENHFDGKHDRVGKSGQWGITGFLPYGGVLNAVVDSNLYTYCMYGIHTVSMVPRDTTAAYVGPSYFNLYMNNIMQDCQQDLGQGLSASFTYTNTLEMASNFGAVYRNNTAGNTVAGNTKYGIYLEAQPNGSSNAMDFTLFDQNTITDTPSGIYCANPNTWSMGTQGNLLFQQNAISLGSAVSASSCGITTVAGTKVGFGGNSYTGFATTYAGTPPGALLEAPQRVFDATASSITGISATANATVWNAGSSSLTWNASSDQSWLAVLATSGTVTNENGASNFTITCAPGALGDGLYVGNLTLTSGTQTKRMQVNFTVAGLDNAPPTIAGLTNQSTGINTATAALAFTVADSGTTAGSLIVSATSSNPTLVSISNIALGGSGSNRTVAITPTTDQVGNALITLTVIDGNGLSTSGSFTLTVQGSPLQTWRQANFGTAANSGSAADTADSDGDGVPNLTEYALNMNPKAPDQSKLPVVGISGVYLTLKFRKPATTSGITYRVQVSGDLVVWSDVNVANNTVAAGFDSDGTPTLTVRDDVPMTGGRRFMKLMVTDP